jgi:hypothetical protein
MTVAAILQYRSATNSAPTLCLMSVMYTQKKPMGVKPGLLEEQLIGSCLPIYRPADHSSRAVRTLHRVVLEWADCTILSEYEAANFRHNF